MELRQLRYFVAVAEELHYGRAARRLNIAQPGLSQQIKVLERRLGAELFARDRRGVALTGAGRALLPLARDLLTRAGAAQALVRSYGAGETGELRVGLTRSAAQGVTARLVDGFREECPGVEMRLSSGYTALHERLLRLGSLDAAFVRPPIDLAGDLACREVAVEPLVAVVPVDHPLARRRRIRRADLAGEPLVWWPREHGPGMWDRMLDQVFGAGVRPPVARWEPEEERLLHAVALGAGVTVVVEGRASRLRVPGVAIRRFAEPEPTVPLGLAWRRDSELPALRRFLRHAEEVVRSEAR
ncbi:LysR family transcriptional regulator [Streptomyces sp. NPDC127098]|uniref:LysR family transcriptional regulator n=1 Tax=Streptomyces sp. NPDC127098 TaxID=3347137 RepID=UPI0036498506